MKNLLSRGMGRNLAALLMPVKERFGHIKISAALTTYILTEPRHEKTRFMPMRKQRAQISFAVTAKLCGNRKADQRLCFH